MAAGKVALITGGTRGIGYSIASALCQAGCARVIVTGSGTKEPSAIEDIVKKLSSENAKVRVDYIGADLSKREGIKELCQQVSLVCPEGVDILVNNAGVSNLGMVDELSETMWDESVSLMVHAPFFLIQHSLPKMKEKGWGRIINISSMLGLVGKTRTSLYSTCKHGLNGMTKSVALEVAETGITCNSLCLGMVYTDMLKNAMNKGATQYSMSGEAVKQRFENSIPTKCLMESEEVGPFVVLLCSDSMKNMTGSCVAWDAGYTAQ